jgi:hypothetical protein
LAGFEGTLYGRFWVTPEALVDFGWTTTSKRPAAPMPSVTNRLGHPDAVLAKVESGFALIVPLEAHGSIVRTFCTYVKRVKSPESTWGPKIEPGAGGSIPSLAPTVSTNRTAGAIRSPPDWLPEQKSIFCSYLRKRA